MPNKVLIVCGSPHDNSHSDVLAKAFGAGAQESGNTVLDADIIAFVTPLYFLTVSAQLKVFIDRLYCKHHSGKIRGKKGVLISTSGGPGSAVLTDYFNALCGLAGWEMFGIVTQGGLGRNSEGPDEVHKEEAYKLGKSIV